LTRGPLQFYPSRHHRAARLWRGHGHGTRRTVRHDPAVNSKHLSLKVLERTGFVSRSRSAQTRPCRLKAAPLKEVAQWVEMYRNLWDESFDLLDTFLQSTQPTPMKGRKNGRK
jgi:hypothetical protein